MYGKKGLKGKQLLGGLTNYKKMNIIEAMQAAESGKLITNNFLKLNDRFLKYIKNGVFYQYEIEDGEAMYRYEVREFSMAHVLSIGWEIVDKDYFNNELE